MLEKIIHEAPMLQTEETHELIRRWQQEGDVKAREKLCRCFYKLAYSTARRYRSGSGNHFDDSVQEGMLGVLRAIDKFDPSRGVKFTTYAPWWVHAFVITHVRLKVSTMPHRHGPSYWRVIRAFDELQCRGSDATEEEVAAKLGITPAAVRQALASSRAQRAVPLDVDTSSVLIGLAGDPSPEDLCIQEENRAIAEEIMAEVRKRLADEREQAIFTRRMVAEEPETLNAIGGDYGLTKERIRQLELRIAKKVRDEAVARQDRAA